MRPNKAVQIAMAGDHDEGRLNPMRSVQMYVMHTALMKHAGMSVIR